jgi:hypothetical protein
VLQDTLDTTERGNHVDAVVVELPELAIVTLRRPPEGVADTWSEPAERECEGK